MSRINEEKAAEQFMTDLIHDVYPINSTPYREYLELMLKHPDNIPLAFFKHVIEPKDIRYIKDFCETPYFDEFQNYIKSR